jgi:tetratricopeptide (TPR) repeat protein
MGRPAEQFDRMLRVPLLIAMVLALASFRFGFALLGAAGAVLGGSFAALIFAHAAKSWAVDHRHLRLARWLSVDSWTRRWLDVQLASADGEFTTAYALFDGLPHTALGDVFAWNLFVNGLISRGLYRQAVTARRQIARLHDARTQLPEHYGLVLLNIAEALYNLGRWRRARQLMETLEGNGYLKTALNRAGGQAQMAWIEAHTELAEKALGRLATVDVADFPFDYRAELHFTWAAAHLANNDVANARASLATARSLLVRPSSERNILFLEARCARAEGNLREAARLCELASNHEYRGQGGDGLLLWGDVCEQLGDTTGARRAWQLALERDPESESARRAREKLT